MPRPKSAHRIDLEAAIREAAWKQIAQLGADGLTLRGIARELGITAPAIYNYFPSRDDLVTALIIEAYTEFGDWQLDSLKGISENDFGGGLRATGYAYRQWAVENPQRYQLIFGTPIPGYHAPVEQVTPVAARSLTALIHVLDGALKARVLKAQADPMLEPRLVQGLEAWRELHPVVDVYVLYLALVIWSRVHGMVMIEISNQYPSSIENPWAIYEREIEMLIQQYLKAGAGDEGGFSLERVKSNGD